MSDLYNRDEDIEELKAEVKELKRLLQRVLQILEGDTMERDIFDLY